MLRNCILAAALAAATMGFTAATADAAPYRVIRWAGTGYCQVWDYGVSRPFGVYKVMNRPKSTMSRALRTKCWLLRKYRCNF